MFTRSGDNTMTVTVTLDNGTVIRDVAKDELEAIRLLGDHMHLWLRLNRWDGVKATRVAVELSP